MHFDLSEIIAGVLIKYPKVGILAHPTDRMVDIVGEGFDVAVRAHSDPLTDSNLVQRGLVLADWYLFAEAKYLERHCEPVTPDDLNGHASLLMTRPASPLVWRLRRESAPHKELVHPISPRFVSDDVLGLQKAALMGLGIVALPTFVARDAARCGELRRVLPDRTVGRGNLTALIPYRQRLLPSVRAFLDYLAAEAPKLVLP